MPLAELSAPTRLHFSLPRLPFFLGGAHSQPIAAVHHTAHKHQITDKSLEAAWPHPRLCLDSETIRGTWAWPWSRHEARVSLRQRSGRSPVRWFRSQVSETEEGSEAKPGCGHKGLLRDSEARRPGCHLGPYLSTVVP